MYITWIFWIQSDLFQFVRVVLIWFYPELLKIWLNNFKRIYFIKSSPVPIDFFPCQDVTLISHCRTVHTSVQQCSAWVPDLKEIISRYERHEITRSRSFPVKFAQRTLTPCLFQYEVEKVWVLVPFVSNIYFNDFFSIAVGIFFSW